MPPVRRTISLNGTASLMSAMMAAFVCLRRRHPSTAALSAQVSSFGWIVVAPIAVRMTRMEWAYRVEEDLNSPELTPLDSDH
jgi:hypothetical protein